MKTQSIVDRVSKVDASHQAPAPKALSMELLGIFPDVLAARSLRTLVDRIVNAHQAERPVFFTMGAHPIKCGLTPVLIKLMRKGVLTGIATNGASIVHDIEMSVFGQTSEDVISSLKAGTFGCTEETHRIFQDMVSSYDGKGLGESVGQWLLDYYPAESEQSLFAIAQSLGQPVSVHPSLGTDVLHMNPALAWGRMAAKSQLDFGRSRNRVSWLANGGVLVNWGSAVMLPEVILKAVGICRNNGLEFGDFTMADFDMIRQYRSQSRIVDVANALGGTGLSITGHHEIMMPLLAGLVLGALEGK